MKKHLLALMMMFGGLLINAQNIYTGQTLEQNRKYWAGNNRYYLIFQNDGNLVLYNRAGASIWDARTTNRGVKAIFQEDGNLVVYTPGNGVAFSSNTNGRRADKLTVQDDGNLVIYSRSNPVWASKDGNKNDNGYGRGGGSVNTGHKFRRGEKLFSPDRNYYLIFQNDGNLVLSNNNGDPIWGTGTDNKGSRAEFQNDGNLVVYDSYNKSVWSSNTSRRGGTKLTVQNDGNLVIYGDYSPIWSSGTQR
ncbi:PQQ-binding-like beta-propeller repeat protein [Chryseobacterium sp. CBSDS_008]|uniref:outer membrane protein assembly factor BamB family protein n=1 Tax=Chryseobacterium sp. CBSDS_008 TaxID=3415265 RepID=UPI003CEEF60C